MFRRDKRWQNKRSYYFIPRCSFTDLVISRVQSSLDLLCRSDKTIVKLQLIEACSMPKSGKIYEVPLSVRCRSLHDFASVESIVLAKMQETNAFTRLAEGMYWDSEDGNVSKINVMFALTDKCPVCLRDGLLIVWY